MRVLVVDNYDSFTFNLVQYLQICGATCEVVLNDRIDAAGARERRPDGILISPGPCTPNDAGATLSIVESLSGEVPILGVCLGHQAIGQVFGGEVVRAERVLHGKTSPIHHDERTIYAGLPQPFEATRYHSLIVARASVPDCLTISAWTAEGEVMGLRHVERRVEGVQFHPESILTEAGMALVRNWTASLAAGSGAARG